MTNRGRKVIQGFLFRNMYTILNIGIAFFMMPFILHSLGDRMYGLWILIGSFMGYMGYLDLGISAAVSRFIARAIGRNDLREVNEIVNTSFVLYLLIGVITLLLTAIVIIFTDVFVRSPEDLRIIRTLVFVVGLNLAIGFPTRAFGGVIGANLRYGVSEGIMITELLVRNTLIIIFFNMGFRIVSLGFIMLFASMVSYVLWVYFAFYVQSGMRLDLKFFCKSKVKELLSYSIYAFVSKFSEILRFRLDSFVITIFVSLAAVAHYSIAAVLVGYLSNFAYRAVELLGPIFSQDEGRGYMESISYKIFFTTKLFTYLTMFFCMLMIFYGQYFIIRWVGEDYVDSYPVLAVLASAVMFSLMQLPARSALFSISRHKFLAWVGVGEGISNLILSLILVRHYGIMGVAIGTAIPMVLTKFFIDPLYMCRVFNVSKSLYYWDVLGKSFIIGLIGLLPMYFILRNYAVPSYSNLCVLGMVQFVVYGLVILFLGLNQHERKYLLAFLNRRKESQAMGVNWLP